MSRNGYRDLPKAPREFEKRLQKEMKFERKSKALDDDLDRGKRLGRYAKLGGAHALEAKRLARRLEGEVAPETVASRRDMRQFRLNITHALEQLVLNPDYPEAMVATVMPERWEMLADADRLIDMIQKRLEALRKLIERQCPPKPHGWLFGYLDTDYAPEPDRFRLHVHLAASGDFLRAVNNLRNVDAITAKPLLSYGSDERRPVQIKRIKPGTEARALSYIVKSAHFRTEFIVDGKRCKGPKAAIPDPYHSELLIALDRLDLNDFIITKGLTVTAKGLRVRRP